MVNSLNILVRLDEGQGLLEQGWRKFYYLCTSFNDTNHPTWTPARNEQIWLATQCAYRERVELF